MHAMSALASALGALDGLSEREALTTCCAALARSVVFVGAARSTEITRTGHEPAYGLVVVRGRALIVMHLPDVGTCLVAFSDRGVATAWSEKVPGFTAEPIDGPALAETAVLAGVAAVIIDPCDEARMFLIRRPVVEWGPALRRPLGSASLGEAATAYAVDATSPNRHACQLALRDAVVFLHVAPARDEDSRHRVRIFGWDVRLDEDAGRQTLTVYTDRAIAEQTAEEDGYQALAVDGPAAVTAAWGAGADLGLIVGDRKSFAEDVESLPLWPGRELTASDF